MPASSAAALLVAFAALQPADIRSIRVTETIEEGRTVWRRER